MATRAEVEKQVEQVLGPEYSLSEAVHGDGEAYSANVMHGHKVAIRAQSDDPQRSLTILSEALNALWLRNMTAEFGHCSQ